MFILRNYRKVQTVVWIFQEKVIPRQCALALNQKSDITTVFRNASFRRGVQILFRFTYFVCYISVSLIKKLLIQNEQNGKEPDHYFLWQGCSAFDYYPICSIPRSRSSTRGSRRKYVPLGRLTFWIIATSSGSSLIFSTFHNCGSRDTYKGTSGCLQE